MVGDNVRPDENDGAPGPGGIHVNGRDVAISQCSRDHAKLHTTWRLVVQPSVKLPSVSSSDEGDG